MAERRMFAKTIIDSDSFLDMPLSTQALYFHLSMRADDEGFINNPRKIQRMIGAADDDLRVLTARKFIIPFESGIVVIKHWKIHNYIRGDRIRETKYTDERALLDVKENGAYTISADKCPALVRQLTDTCQAVDGQEADGCPSNVRIGKDSIGKDSIDKNIRARAREETPQKHRYGEYKNVLLSDDDLEKLKNEFPDDYEKRIEALSEGIASKGYKYKNHLAALRSWARRDAERGNTAAGTRRQTKAEELDGFYSMAAKWAEEASDE